MQSLTGQVQQMLHAMQQGADNEVRKQAEEGIKQLRATQAKVLLSSFGEIIFTQGASSEQDIKPLACLLLKKFYLDDRPEEAQMEQITGEEISMLKQKLKDSLQIEVEPMNLLRRKAEIICKLHRREESYGELLQQLESLARLPPSNGEERVVKSKVFAMYMFELLCEYHLPQEQIQANSQSFMSLFQESLKDTNVKVRTATLKALTNFLTVIDEEEIVLQYRVLMPELLDVVIEVLKADESEGQASLQSLIELTQTYAELWQSCVDKLLFVCSEVMRNGDFEQAPRQSALEIISTLAEENPKMLRDQSATLQQHFFPTIGMMMTQVEDEDDLDAWANKAEEEVLAKNDISSVAAEALERLADVLGEKTIMASSAKIIQEAVSNQGSWQFRQAGYLYLGMIAESCKKTFKKNIDETIAMVARGIIDEHPRVRYQALMALGLLLNVLSPTVQQKFHAEMVPQLFKMMKEEPLIKSQSQAVSACVNFVRGLINDGDEAKEIDEDTQEKNKQLLAHYSTDLVNIISVLLQKSIDQSYAPLQEETLALLSCLAEVLSEHFAQHYQHFMPALKQILMTTPQETTQQKDLRSNCISTIGNILESIKGMDNKDLFKADAQQIAEALITNQLNRSDEGKMEDSDPQILAIQNMVPQLAVCLKEDFRPFLPPLMESLFRDAKRSLDFKVVDADEAELEDADEPAQKGMQKIKMQIKGQEGQKIIQMNTSNLENKLNAVKIIKQIAQVLGPIFVDYVEPMTQLLISELLHDKLSSTIRKDSSKMCNLLLNCLPERQMQIKLLKMLLPHLCIEMKTKMEKQDFRTVKQLAKEVHRCLHVFSKYKGSGDQALLNEQERNGLVELCEQVITNYKIFRQNQETELAQLRKKLDEEDLEAEEEVIQSLDKVYEFVCDISGTLLKTMSEECSPLVQQKILPHYAKRLIDISKMKDYEILEGLCMVCDCMEFGNDALFQTIVPQAGPKFLEILKSRGLENQEHVQTCIFGLGVLAQRVPNLSPELLGATLQNIDWIMKQNFKDDEGRPHTCNDNAISTLGKCIYYQHAQSNMITAQVKDHFLSKLPLKNDIDEAEATHLLFLQQIQAQNAGFADQRDGVVAAVRRIAEFDQTYPEEDILCEEGRELIKQVGTALGL